jgi:hypothetical protein
LVDWPYGGFGASTGKSGAADSAASPFGAADGARRSKGSA